MCFFDGEDKGIIICNFNYIYCLPKSKETDLRCSKCSKGTGQLSKLEKKSNAKIRKSSKISKFYQNVNELSRMYDNQTLHFNDHLKNAQEQHNKSKKAMQEAMREENLLLVSFIIFKNSKWL